MEDKRSKGAMLRALDLANPDDVVNVLGERLTRDFAASQVHVLLANYQLTAMRPVLVPDEPVRLDETAAGRAFTSQEPVLLATDEGQSHVYLPVSVHGDRVGVLSFILPGAVGIEQLIELKDLALLTGYALQATSRQTDLLHRAARSRRLTLAAELQWQLLPARGCRTPQYELAGHLEPAYTVHADNFDWSQDQGRMQVSITDAAHDQRCPPPLLTTLSVTAARNARRAGMDLAAQTAMVDQAIYAHHQGEHSVGTIVVDIDTATGYATAIRAGSPQALLWREGKLQAVGLTEQLPLGMFEGTDYTAQSFDLAFGDRLLLVSNGVTDRLSGRGEPHQRLGRVLDKTVSHRPAHVVRAIIDALVEDQGHEDLEDDATAVCLDWNGPGQATELTLSDLLPEPTGTHSHLHAVPPA